MDTPASIEKLAQEQDVVYASSSIGEVGEPKKDQWAYLKHYFTSREGWIGDYVCLLSYLKSPKLTWKFTGLSLPRYPQHLAPEPQVQGLRSTILWTQR
jgi:hypothetical protein